MPGFNFIIYILAVIASFVFQQAYIGWFGDLLIWTVALFPPVIFLMSLPAILTGKASFTVPDRIQLGEKHMGYIEVRSRSLLPIGRIIMKVRIENRFTGEVSYRTFKYADLGRCKCSFSLPSDHCGLLVCSMESLCFCDLLGLFRFKRPFPTAAECTVMPSAKAPDTIPDIESALDCAKVLRPKTGGGYSEDHELREYRPGDTVRSIHWKLTSKLDEVIIREPLVSEKTEIYVILSPEGDVEKSISVLLWLSETLGTMELAHSIVWRHEGYDVRVAHIVSDAAALDAAAAMLSSPCVKASVPDLVRALCAFEVHNGEVHIL